MTWQRTVIFLAWAVVTTLLVLGWARNSVETTRFRRLAELYLWVFSLPLAIVGLAYVRVGLVGFAGFGVVHLICVAVALVVLGRRSTTVDSIRSTSALLILGPTMVFLGAITWPGDALARVGQLPAEHTNTAALFTAGSLVTLAGFTGLRAALRAAGDDWLSRLGLMSLQLGTGLWMIHLLFRITVTRPIAEQMATPPPPWFDLVRNWSGGMYAVYMMLAYLATAAFGAALGKTRWIGAAWGRGLVVFGLVGAAGFLIPGPFRPPLVVQLPVYAIGILLLRKLAAGTAGPRTA